MQNIRQVAGDDSLVGKPQDGLPTRIVFRLQHALEKHAVDLSSEFSHRPARVDSLMLIKATSHVIFYVYEVDVV